VQGKLAKLKDKTLISVDDLVVLDRLLERKRDTQSEANLLELQQLRVVRKIKFLMEFIKARESLLSDKRVLLDKSKLLTKELDEKIATLIGELKGRFGWTKGSKARSGKWRAR
jgi:hypothetical protein